MISEHKTRRPAQRQTRHAQRQTQPVVYPRFVPPATRAQDEAADAVAKAAAEAAALAASGYKPPATQADLDQIIENRLSRERTAFRKELDALKSTGGGTKPDDLHELDTLRREKIERERKAAEDKGQYDRAVESIRKEHETEKAKIAEEKVALLKELHQTRCYDTLLAGASTANAVNPQQVARLLADNVKLNEDRKVVVLDDDGNPWLKAGKNISIADLVEKFAHDNPHLFKAPAAGAGSGAKGGAGTADEALEGIDEKIALAEETYKAANKIAAESGAIPDIDASRQARRVLEALKLEKKTKAKAA